VGEQGEGGAEAAQLCALARLARHGHCKQGSSGRAALMACARSFYFNGIRTHSRAVGTIREGGLSCDRVTARARKTARTAPLKQSQQRIARAFYLMCSKHVPRFPPPWFPPHPLPRRPPCFKVPPMRGQPIRQAALRTCGLP